MDKDIPAEGRGRQPHLCLFFSYGMSLKEWAELGLFDREVSYYRRLAQQGVGVTFFTYGDSEDLGYGRQLPGIRIVPAYAGCRRPKTRIGGLLDSLVLPLRFRKVLAGFDLFKTNQMWGAWVPVLSSLLNTIPVIVRCGYEFYSFCLKDPRWWTGLVFLLSRLSYSRAAKIILTSEQSRSFVRRKFHQPDDKIAVLPNFIDTSVFAPADRTGIVTDRVVSVGRLTEQKNLFSLIAACKKAGVGLDIVGQGELQERLEQHSGIEQADVRFLGSFPNSELPGILNRYSIYLLPSLYEGCPKTLLEAMSCGLAVIGTRVDGITEIIADGRNGLLCGTGPDDIAAAIQRLVQDPGLVRELGGNGRRYIEDNCSIDALAVREIILYQQVLGGGFGKN